MVAHNCYCVYSLKMTKPKIFFYFKLIACKIFYKTYINVLLLMNANKVLFCGFYLPLYILS